MSVILKHFSDPIHPIPTRKEITPPRMSSPDSFEQAGSGIPGSSDIASQVINTFLSY